MFVVLNETQSLKNTAIKRTRINFVFLFLIIITLYLTDSIMLVNAFIELLQMSEPSGQHLTKKQTATLWTTGLISPIYSKNGNRYSKNVVLQNSP